MCNKTHGVEELCKKYGCRCGEEPVCDVMCYTCNWSETIYGHQCSWTICRKRSPIQSILNSKDSGNRQAEAIWPTVKKDDTCGDWQEKI